MNHRPRSFLYLCMILAGIVALLFPGAGAMAAVGVTALARFGGTPDGYHPMAALVDGGDGFYYGTTEAGGPANCGTVYKVAPDGTFATLYTFTGASDGANPMAALVSGGDGFFYGTATAGGVNGNGTVFKISPAGGFTSLYSFSALDASSHNADGTVPRAALIAGGDGFFYGTASQGGTAGYGTIFRVSPGGTFNAVCSLATRDGGTLPYAALTLGGDGYLYGAASAGGTGNAGTIFRVTPAGAFQVLYSFTNGADGGSPKTALVLSGGQFYGLTQRTFFSVTPSGTLATLYTYSTANGTGSFGGLITGVGGNFYGTTIKDSPDGSPNVFEVTPAGAFTVLHVFADTTDGTGLSSPPLLGGDGNLYGVAFSGGNGNAAGYGGGTIYQLAPASGVLDTLHAFAAGSSYAVAALTQYSDGNFYGVTQQGGAKNGGTFFGVAPGGAVAVPLMDFDPDTQGSHPVAGLVLAGDGSLYGSLAANGPDGGGTIFQMVPGSSTGPAAPTSGPGGGFHTDFTLDPIHPFDPFGFILNLFCNSGDYPGPGDNATGAAATASAGPVGQTIYEAVAPSALVFGPGAVLYGILQEGGDAGDGSIFSHVPGSAPTIVHSFGVTAGDGILPEGLVTGADGNFYGTTYGGGAATEGTIFKYGSDGTYAVLYSFQGQGDGAYPQTGLTAGRDGNLYGVTQHASYGASSGFTGAPAPSFPSRRMARSPRSIPSPPMAPKGLSPWPRSSRPMMAISTARPRTGYFFPLRPADNSPCCISRFTGPAASASPGRLPRSFKPPTATSTGRRPRVARMGQASSSRWS